MSKSTNLGPGTVRVGRFIGRLGVVSLPAVAVGLDLDERVVRRHVAKLESAGWLGREPWIWGEGSVVWLTVMGIAAAGLGGVRPVKAPPSPTTISHGVLVGWSAARLERRGRTWKSSRELAVDTERWATPMRCERGYTTQLPDLAAWLEPEGPTIALVAETGHRREDRQKLILEGWRDAILADRYWAVRYDCTNDGVARLIKRLAKKVGLAGPKFAACLQPSATDIEQLVEADAERRESDAAAPTVEQSAPRPQPTGAPTEPRVPTPVERFTPREPDTAEVVAQRMQQYHDVFGIEDPKRGRGFRRRR